MWDVSTSDMTRDVNPGLEGIMQQLCLSPDNRYAAAYTNYNEVPIPTQNICINLYLLF